MSAPGSSSCDEDTEPYDTFVEHELRQQKAFVFGEWTWGSQGIRCPQETRTDYFGASGDSSDPSDGPSSDERVSRKDLGISKISRGKEKN